MADKCSNCDNQLMDCMCEVCLEQADLPAKKAICCSCRHEADPCFEAKRAIAQLDANELHQMATDVRDSMGPPTIAGLAEALSRWASS